MDWSLVGIVTAAAVTALLGLGLGLAAGYVAGSYDRRIGDIEAQLADMGNELAYRAHSYATAEFIEDVAALGMNLQLADDATVRRIGERLQRMSQSARPNPRAYRAEASGLDWLSPHPAQVE